MPAAAAPLWLPSLACGRLCRRRGRRPPRQPGGEATRRRGGEAARRLGPAASGGSAWSSSARPGQREPEGGSGGRARARLAPSSSSASAAAAASFSFHSSCSSGQSLWKKGSGRGAEGSWPAPRRPPGQRGLKRKNCHLSAPAPTRPHPSSLSPRPDAWRRGPSPPTGCLKGKCFFQLHCHKPLVPSLRSLNCSLEIASGRLGHLIYKLY